MLRVLNGLSTSSGICSAISTSPPSRPAAMLNCRPTGRFRRLFQTGNQPVSGIGQKTFYNGGRLLLRDVLTVQSLSLQRARGDAGSTMSMSTLGTGRAMEFD